MKQRLRLFTAKMMTEEEAMNWRNLIFSDLLLWQGGQRIDGVKFFINFSPAISTKSRKKISKEIRSWNLHERSDKSLLDLANIFNPMLQGYISYYSKFYKSAMYPLFQRLNERLAHWVSRKFKRCRRHKTRAIRWLGSMYKQNPTLFAHWKFGVNTANGMNVPLRLNNRSRMTGDCHVRIWERLRGKFPGSTRFILMKTKHYPPKVLRRMNNTLTRMGLAINQKKTKLLHISKSSFCFLGFEFRMVQSKFKWNTKR